MAVKQLSNCMFAVLFTNGYLHIISAESEKKIAVIDLLGEQRTGSEKVIRGKLDFVNRAYNFGDSNLSLEVSAAYMT